ATVKAIASGVARFICRMADVIDLESVGYWTHKKGVGKAVNQDAAPLYAKAAVSIGHACASPNPAAVRNLLDLGEEAHLDGGNGKAADLSGPTCLVIVRGAQSL